ncbi:MAG: hypothetical protein WC358_07245 [Ignavibacteria bacterium]|jgi:hypothetical protein
MIKYKSVKYFELFFIIFFINGISFSQYNTNKDIENLFGDSFMHNLSFTNESFWAFPSKGLMRINNKETRYYKLDTNSSGILSNFLSNGDTNGLNYFLTLFPACYEDVWIGFYATDYLLRIHNDTIYNYKLNIEGKKKRFMSYFVDKDSIPWFHFKVDGYNNGDSIINYVYCYKNNSFQLKYSFNTKFFGNPDFFILNNRPMMKTVEAVNSIFYLSLYELNSTGNRLLFRVGDKENGFTSSRFDINNDTLYLLTTEGELYSIDANANIFKFSFKLERYIPANKFFIYNGKMIYKSIKNIIKIDLKNGDKIFSEDLSQCDSCKRYIWDMFLSRDNYIYCTLKSSLGEFDILHEKPPNIEIPEKCRWEKLKILNIDF